MGIQAKNALLATGILATIAFAYAAVQFSGAYAQGIDPASTRSFSVLAEGKIVAVPDTAEFTFGVITEGNKALSILQEENTTAMNNILQAMKSVGVEERDLQTNFYSISPRYQYIPCYSERDTCPPPDISGYTISQTVQVRVRDLAKTGELLALATSKGANSISQISLIVDDREELEQKAREIAISKAQEKAKNIAVAAKVRLGRLLQIEEYNTYPGIYPSYLKEGMGGAEDMAIPSIEPGTQEITIQIMLRYEIK
ncbi:MAG: SIMPL domain-containing protein [bacterium]|nr:SIMPL domain-containing protein [bacterium]